MLKKILHKTNSKILKKFVKVKKASPFLHFENKYYRCNSKLFLEEQELYKAKKIIENQKSKKKKIISLSLLIVNFLIIAGFLVYYSKTSGIVSFRELIYMDIKYRYLLLAVLMVVLVIFFESLRINYLIKQSTSKSRFCLSLKTHIKGKYYDNVTPFAIGGQPFQVFYLNKHGIKGDVATSIPVAKQIYTNITITIISLVVLIMNIFYPVTSSPIIIVFACIGLLFNCVIVFLMVLFSINKKLGVGLVVVFLKFLYKLRIIKNYQKTFFKVNKFIINYQKIMKKFTKNIWTFLIQFVLTIIMFVCYYFIIYFIYLAFFPVINASMGMSEPLSYTDIISCITMCDLCTSIMPLPGGTGLAELSFDSVFRTWFGSGRVFPWAMLIWRTLSCFIYLIIGGIQIAISYIKHSIKNKKKKDIK